MPRAPEFILSLTEELGCRVILDEATILEIPSIEHEAR